MGKGKGSGKGYGEGYEQRDLEYGTDTAGNQFFKNDVFQDAEGMDDIGRGFIRKVYALLSVQLFITLGTCALFLYSQGVRAWLYGNDDGKIGRLGGSATLVFYLAIFTSFAVIIMMSCGYAMNHPADKICLGVFTIAESLMIGIACAGVEPRLVITAVGLTALIVLGLTLFTFQSSYDFTSWGGVLFVCLIAFVGVGFFQMFLPMSKPVYLVFCGIGVLLFSAYLIYDTKIIMERAAAGEIDGAAIAALTLYLDIINIFLYILSILQILDR